MWPIDNMMVANKIIVPPTMPHFAIVGTFIGDSGHNLFMCRSLFGQETEFVEDLVLSELMSNKMRFTDDYEMFTLYSR